MYGLYNYVLVNGFREKVDVDDTLKLRDCIPLLSPAQYLDYDRF